MACGLWEGKIWSSGVDARPGVCPRITFCKLYSLIQICKNPQLAPEIAESFKDQTAPLPTRTPARSGGNCCVLQHCAKFRTVPKTLHLS